MLFELDRFDKAGVARLERAGWSTSANCAWYGQVDFLRPISAVRYKLHLNDETVRIGIRLPPLSRSIRPRI
jgi:hypothetical protein